MKFQITTLLALILSGPLVSAASWVFKESPLDGIVEFTGKADGDSSYHHFVKASHLIQATLKVPASKDYAMIFLTTTEVVTRNSDSGPESSERALKFQTEEEARKVMKQILAEMSYSPGVNGPASRAPENFAPDGAVKKDKLEVARRQLRELQQRYLTKHPRYIQALDRVKRLEKQEKQEKQGGK